MASIGQLDLLRLLFGRVLVPEAVHREVAGATGRTGARDVARADWIEVRQVADRALVDQLPRHLGEGEREAIVLGLEAKASFVLLDDMAGRVTATRMGLDVVGVAGVLVRAKAEGCIHSVKPLLDGLRTHGLWLHEDVYTAVLRRAGEE